MRATSFIAVLLVNATMLAAVVPLDCWQLRKHGREQDSQTCFERLTHSEDAAIRAEGFWGLENWDRANEQFRLATQSTDNRPEIKVRWGMLLHERFNNKEAADLFREVLTKDPANADAYLGLAIVSADSFDGKAMFYVNKALTLNPKRAKAHELAGSLALENDDRDLSAAEADKALNLEGDAVDAMSIHAAIALLNEQSPDNWLAKIRAINPHYGAAYSSIAHQLELHYRHEDAVTFYRRAIAADPRLWSAHSDLGIGLMRLGQQEEAQKELELSYNNGYRDAATVNSLRLLDSYKNYITIRDQTTVLTLRKTESDLLKPYFQDELHRIITTYNTKYQLTLPRAVKVEVYPDHEDFAVRTMGMPGLGALGVTFGEVVAIDSPSARKPGDFNWGATLWHEMSHVYVLTATKNHVPRWFTEGLAVHEEGEHSPEWANRLTPEIIVAIRDKKLLPILKLDRGFVYPEYPSQVVVSYFQAGSICDFIKGKWGEPTLLEMVNAFAERQTTGDVIKHKLDLTTDEFDRQYIIWIENRYASQVSHFDTWRQSLKQTAAAASGKQWDVVITETTKALPFYPEYVGEDSMYQFLADAYHAQNNTKAEAQALSAYERAGGENPIILKHLAEIKERAGDTSGAAETLSRVNYIYPVNDAELHRHLGDLLYNLKVYDQAAREYAAAVASHPVDRAGAQFLLAKAYLAAGHTTEAEESVLAALEIAPGYAPAQKMLLELHQSPEK